MKTGLDGKVILVTGGSGGIGSEVVKTFAAEGAKVAIHYHQKKEAAEKLAANLAGHHMIVGGDLSSEEATLKVFASIEQTLGPVEVLVANSGIWVERDTPIHEMSLKQWNATLNTNLTSMFLCLREFFKGVIKHKIEAPSAVLVGSTAGIHGEAGHCDYAASKSAATYGLMLTLKNELARIAPRGRINSVCPGWVMTPMADTFAKNQAAVSKALQTVALRKVGRPSDIAAAILFLSSNALSGHVSGHSLVLAGGMEGRVLYSPEEIDLSRV